MKRHFGSAAARPRDVVSFFSPAYSAGLLNALAAGYQKERNVGLPFVLAFIALPLLLYPDWVARLPSKSSSRLGLWIDKNSDLLALFPARAANIAAFVREAIIFGCAHGLIRVGAEGAISPVGTATPKGWPTERHALAAVKGANVLGRVLGGVGDERTILFMLGVKP